MSKKINIQYITGSRADFGIISDLIYKLKKNKSINLNITAIGSHSLQEFGNTINEIKNKDLRLNILKIKFKTKNFNDITSYCSKLINKISNNFKKTKPKLLLILGDRYEIFIASFVATIFKIPIVHFCGGDITQGSYDDKFRNAITQLSNFHFTTNKKSKLRVIKLLGVKKNIYNFGHLSLDHLKDKVFLSRAEIEKKFQINFSTKNILITFHPLTNHINKTKKNFGNLIKVLDKNRDINYIFTSPNADQESVVIKEMIEEFVKKNKNAFYVKSFGQNYYFSLLKNIDGVMGNSSSGILEVPSFKKAVINIGDRQNGRIFAKNIINCNYSTKNIQNSINHIFTNQFKRKLKDTKNYYYKKNALKNTYKQILKITDTL